MNSAMKSIVHGAIAASLAVAIPSTAAAQTTYSSIPVKLPGNVPSQAFEATSTSEFGDEIAFTPGTGRAPITVDVVMSSWGCETGHWYSGDCGSRPGSTFDVPITLNIYAVDTSGVLHAPGALLATVTQTFQIRFRPSADTSRCTSGRWYNPSDKTCYNGYAGLARFNLSQLNVTLPDAVIWSVAYNTSHYGYAPIGQSAPCYTSSGGCGYDSLNVGVETFTPDILVGTDVDPDGAFLNSSWGGAYCDGGVSGVGTFRNDTGNGSGCWLGFRPLVEFHNAQRGPGR